MVLGISKVNSVWKELIQMSWEGWRKSMAPEPDGVSSSLDICVTLGQLLYLYEISVFLISKTVMIMVSTHRIFL